MEHLKNLIEYDKTYTHIEANECSFVRCTFYDLCVFKTCELIDCNLMKASTFVQNYSYLVNTEPGSCCELSATTKRFSNHEQFHRAVQRDHSLDQQPTGTVVMFSRKVAPTPGPWRAENAGARRMARAKGNGGQKKNKVSYQKKTYRTQTFGSQKMVTITNRTNKQCQLHGYARESDVYALHFIFGNHVFTNSIMKEKLHLRKNGVLNVLNNKGTLLVDGEPFHEPPKQRGRKSQKATTNVAAVESSSSSSAGPRTSDNVGICCVCLESRVDTLLRPCKHIICEQCCKQLPLPKLCPTCRSSVQSTEHVYL